MLNGVREPTDATLAKYGLSRPAWAKIATRQKFTCAICKTLPPSGRLYIDHLHARGWRKMSPKERALYVRGLLCYSCNTVAVRRGMTPKKLRAAAEYLEDFDRRYLEAIRHR